MSDSVVLWSVAMVCTTIIVCVGSVLRYLRDRDAANRDWNKERHGTMKA